MKKIIIALILTETILIGLLIYLSIKDNGEKQKADQGLYVAPFTASTIFEEMPIRAIPTGYFLVKTDLENEHAGSIYVGTDPSVIPSGTFLFIIDLGFRVATQDSRASGKIIIIYNKCDQEKLFIWGVTKYWNDEKKPFVLKL